LTTTVKSCPTILSAREFAEYCSPISVIVTVSESYVKSPLSNSGTAKPLDETATTSEEKQMEETKEDTIKIDENNKQGLPDEPIVKIEKDEKPKSSSKPTESKSEMSELFSKKKPKIKKGQKNLWLKEETIEVLEKLKASTGYGESEIIDMLVESYLKTVKSK
jgi:hypothetical protein